MLRWADVTMGKECPEVQVAVRAALQNNRQFRAGACRPGSKNDNTKCDGAAGTGQITKLLTYVLRRRTC